MRQNLTIMIVGGNFMGKGAEAMMLTVRDAIHQSLQEARFCVAVSNKKLAQQYETQGFIPVRNRSWGGLPRRLHAILLLAGVTAHSRVDVSNVSSKGIANPFRVADVVVDVSGFASSDQFGPLSGVQRWRSFQAMRVAGCRVIYMPQSWGPFEKPWVRRFTRPLVRDAELVFAREALSRDHLDTLKISDARNVRFARDIAFKFKPDGPEVGADLLAHHGVRVGDRPIIAIAPNMRIYERTEGKGHSNAYFRMLSDILDMFLKQTSCSVILMPHEISMIRPNDPELCEMLMEHDTDGRVVSFSGCESAAAMKSALGHAEFVVASRYHSLVAAMSMRVPSVVIGWSHKYDELMKAVGQGEWVIDPVRRSGKGAQETVRAAWAKRNELSTQLVEYVPEIEESANEALKLMVECIRNFKGV